MTKGVKVTLAVVAGLAALSGLCCVGTLALGLLGDSSGSPGTAATSTGGSFGAGFSFEPPASFQSTGEGRWRRELRDDTELFWVNLVRLPAVSGLEGADEKLASLWNQGVAGAFSPLPTMERIVPPLVQRRFVQNGARAHFGRARLFQKGTTDAVYVTLYLVEADDHLEPFLVVQGCESSAMGSAMICNFSFARTHVWIEELMKGISGSPTGAPLVSDEELVGHYQFGDTSTAQWVNTITGATSMTAVARAIDFTFNDDHTYRYKFTGGSGQVGAIRFATDEDQGTWKVEHDVLVLAGEKHQYKYFLTGAPKSPEGTQLILMQPTPNWSLAPEASNELYARKE
ncbi:MAG: hypothetical protein ACOZQL_17075 [Myxococcota bacterium]